MIVFLLHANLFFLIFKCRDIDAFLKHFLICFMCIFLYVFFNRYWLDGESQFNKNKNIIKRLVHFRFYFAMFEFLR